MITWKIILSILRPEMIFISIVMFHKQESLNRIIIHIQVEEAVFIFLHQVLHMVEEVGNFKKGE